MAKSSSRIVHVPAVHTPAAHEQSDGDHQASDLTTSAVGVPIVIALGSRLCFCSIQSLADAERSRSLDALAYDLEEQIPIDGDSLAIGTIRLPDGRLIVATDGSCVRQSLEELGLDVGSIEAAVPAVMLIVHWMLRTKKASSYSAIFLHSPDAIDAVLVEGRVVTDWRWILATQSELTSLVSSWSLEVVQQPTLMINFPADWESAWQDDDRYVFERIDIDQALQQESDLIAAGKINPIVDLRTGPLAPADPHRAIRKPLMAFAAAWIALQLIVMGSVWYRANRYQQLASELAFKQQSEFERTFPDEPIPVGMVARLESEQRRLVETRGDAKVPTIDSVMPMIKTLLASLPDASEAKYAIERIEFRPSEIRTLLGTAESYLDLEVVTKRMQSGGIDVPPVSSTVDRRGVSMRFDGVTLQSSSAGSP